jgi:plasmid maintenance system antidote protein VapI
VPANRITAILKAPISNRASRTGGITGDTALRLAAFFGHASK